MSDRVYLGYEPSISWDPPIPPKPKNDDVDPSSYIPQGMTAEDRKALREAGLEWTDTLGSVRGGLVGWAASLKSPTGSNTFARAGENIHHFRHGGGSPVSLSEREVSDLQAMTGLFSAVEKEFLDLIEADMAPRPVDTRRHYLAINKNSNSTNAGTPWFGAYATKGTGWYYAMGGFLLAYGAVTWRVKGATRGYYRTYVYDRYNWDLHKDTDVPSRHLSILLDDSVMERIAGLRAPDGNDYFKGGTVTRNRNGDPNGYELGETYTPADAMLGALEESGDARRYDINGTGRIQHFQFSVAEG